MLEGEKRELGEKLKGVMSAKVEVEKKKKQLEGQLNELLFKVEEMEKQQTAADAAGGKMQVGV